MYNSIPGIKKSSSPKQGIAVLALTVTPWECVKVVKNAASSLQTNLPDDKVKSLQANTDARPSSPPYVWFCSSNTENATSLRYQNNIKHLVPDSSPLLLQAPPTLTWYCSPPVFHRPLWISKLSRLTGPNIFLPGHSWNRSGLRATYTAPLQPLKTKPALRNCHLNAKHFGSLR